MEKGNVAGVTDEVLSAVTRALRLDEAEQAHLFNLARAARPSRARAPRRRSQQVRPSVQWMLDSMSTAAALVRNGRLDVVAINALGRAFYSPGGVRRAVPVCVVGELAARSKEFRSRWATHNVRLHHAGVKQFTHPVVGAIEVAYNWMDLPGDPGLVLTVYTAEPGSPAADAAPARQLGRGPPAAIRDVSRPRPALRLAVLAFGPRSGSRPPTSGGRYLCLARAAVETRCVHTPADQDDSRSLGLDRIVFFSDAVFAIVITLLVLPITVDVELPASAGGLAREVWSLWPKMLSFVVSFLVIGQFWIAHHRMFGHLRRYDHALLWLNLLTLLTVSFLPFPTALLGAHSKSDDHFAVVFYAASMTVASLALTVTWLYANRVGRLVDPALDRHLADTITTRSLLTSALFLASVAAAFAGGLAAAAPFWLVLLPAARLLLARRQRRRPVDQEANPGRTRGLVSRRTG